MKKSFSKKIVILLLVLATIILSFTGFILADSDDEPTPPDRTDKTSKSTAYKDSSAPIAFPARRGETTDTANLNTYVLSVSTSNVTSDTVVPQVILKYYQSEADYRAGKIAIQVLELIRVENDAAIEKEIEGDLSNNVKKLNSTWPFYGSVFGSYGAMLAGESNFSLDGKTYTKNVSKYLPWAKALVPDAESTQFPALDKKVYESSPRASSSFSCTFRLEHNFYKLHSLSFVNAQPDEKKSMGSLNIYGWGLFRLKDHFVDFDGNGKGTGYNNKTSLGINNYAFISDAIGLTYNGELIVGSTEQSFDKLKDSGANYIESGLLTFYNRDLVKSVLETAETKEGIKYLKEEIPGDKFDDYVSFMTDLSGQGQMELLLCQDSFNDWFETPVTFGNEQLDAKNKTILNFAINLADEYDAGIDTFNKLPITGAAVDEAGKKFLTDYEGKLPDFSGLAGTETPLHLEDLLIAEITYKDKAGYSKKVSVPVVSNSILEFIVPVDELGGISKIEDADRYKKLKNGQYLSYAQQGEAMCFSVEFFELDTLESVDLKFFNSQNENDRIAISNIAVYNNWGYTDTPRRDKYTELSQGASINVYPVGAELLYISQNKENIWLDNGMQEGTFKMLNVAGKDAGLPNQPNYEDCYLIEIATDNQDLASSQCDTYIQFHYTDLDGKAKNSSEYEIQEIIKDYMGYTPGLIWSKDSETLIANATGAVDVSYYQGINAGNTIAFIMKLNDILTVRDTTTGRMVPQINSMSVRCGKTDDEWQMRAITVSAIQSLGKREIHYTGDKLLASQASNDKFVDKTFAFSTNRSYTRSFQGTTIISATPDLMLQHSMVIDYDFESHDFVADEQIRADYSEYKQSMTYAMATSDLQLDTAVKSYDVEVKVASNAHSSGGDDAGSANLFYFQLIFEHGKSGYVLANKQLEADGFRSNTTERFVISMNEDLGDVVSVNIIADDVTSNALPMDKLNIEKLSVIKNNYNKPSKKYVADNVGWISTDYTDTKDSIEKESRKEAQLAYSIPITYSSYMMTLEISMTLGDYGENDVQYRGSMTCDLYYENNDGETKSIPGINVVEKMYEYLGKTPRMNADGSDYMSNPDIMFRPNHTDRFMVEVDDCRIIRRIVFHGDPVASTSIPIKDLNISVLVSKGTLHLSRETKGEFVMQYNQGAEPILVSELKHKPVNGYAFVAQQYNTAFFSLDSIEFPPFDEETKIDTIVSKLPNSDNDNLNIYLYLGPDTKTPSAGDYKLSAVVKYINSQSSDYFKIVTSRFNEKTVEGKKVLCAEGLSAKGLSAIQYLQVYAEPNDIYSSDAGSFNSRQDLQIANAVVQQVRDGVVIDTWEVPFPASNFAKIGGTTTNIFNSLNSSDNKQIVTMILGANTPTSNLVPEEADVAVAIEYESKGMGKRYVSPYVYATDNPDITQIHEGSKLTFEFNEFDVSRIVGVRVLLTGGLTAYINTETGFSGINVQCYEMNENRSQVLTGWYSVATGKTELNASLQKLDVTNSDVNSAYALKCVDLTFRTTMESNNRDSAGTAPIRAKLAYKVDNGTAFVEIPDIRKYISDVEVLGFTAGNDSTVSFFVPGLKSLVSVEIEPYDADPDHVATWNLEQVAYKTEGTSDTSMHYTRVDSIISEDQAKEINLSTIQLALDVQVNDGAKTMTEMGQLEVLLNSGDTITFYPKTYQALSGYRVSIYNIVDGSHLELIERRGSDDDTFSYVLKNPSAKMRKVRFVIESLDIAAANVVVEVTVKPMEGFEEIEIEEDPDGTDYITVTEQ